MLNRARPRITRLAFCVIFLLLPLGWSPAPAQEERTLTGGISETGLRRVPIAVPLFSAIDDDGARALGLEVTRTLRSDLSASGYFVVIPPEHYRLVRRPRAGQDVSVQPAVALGVVDQPDSSRAHVRPPRYAGRCPTKPRGSRGIETRNTLPSPTSLVTVTVPP